MTEAEKIVERFREIGLDNSTIWDIFEFILHSAEVWLDNSCDHLTQRQFKDSYRVLQDIASLTFFFLVQIPLTQVSAAWSFLTAFTIWFLDSKTKLMIYSWVHFFTNLIVHP